MTLCVTLRTSVLVTCSGSGNYSSTTLFRLAASLALFRGSRNTWSFFKGPQLVNHDSNQKDFARQSVEVMILQTQCAEGSYGDSFVVQLSLIKTSTTWRCTSFFPGMLSTSTSSSQPKSTKTHRPCMLHSPQPVVPLLVHHGHGRFLFPLLSQELPPSNFPFQSFFSSQRVPLKCRPQISQCPIFQPGRLNVSLCLSKK